jgi:hypothetical protein
LNKSNIKHSIAGALALLLVAGCEGPAGPEGGAGLTGLAAVAGPFSFTVGSDQPSEPYTDLAAFSAALAVALNSQSAGDSPENPISLKAGGLVLSQKDQLYALWGVLTRYVDLDLSGCTGTLFAATSPVISRQNRVKVVSLTLPESVSALESGTVTTAAFMNFTALRSAAMPGVEVIGDYAFSGCTALESLDLPALTSVEQYAFQNCSALKTLKTPALKYVRGNAFQNCTALRALDLPKLEIIGNNAFLNCGNLTCLNLPGITAIGGSAFSGCPGLSILILGPRHPSVGTALFGTAFVRTITFKVPADTLSDYTAWNTANNTALGGTTITRVFVEI